MKVSVRLHAGLAGKGPDARKDRVVEIDADHTVRGVLDILGISVVEVKVVFLDSKHATLDTCVRENARLDVFPAIAGG